MKEIKGIIPAMVTPFDQNGEVNTDSVKKLVNVLIDENADGFYVCGSTGESLLLSLNERKLILDTVLEAVNGRVPVITQVGCIATREAVELAAHAKKAGADAVSSLPPFYYKFSGKELETYYKTVMDAAELPMIVYNIPALTGVNMFSQCPNLFKDERVYGVKHTTTDLYQMSMFRELNPKLKLYFGSDEQMIAGLSMGADGAIGSTFNFQCKETVALYRTLQNNDFIGGLPLQKKLNEAITLILETGLYNSIKYIIEKKYGYNLSQTLDEIRPGYDFDVTCQGSVPQAIIAFLESTDFEDAIRNAISIGGDSDTIAAITGSIAEAAYGIPDWIKEKALSYLDKTLMDIVNRWEKENAELRKPYQNI